MDRNLMNGIYLVNTQTIIKLLTMTFLGRKGIEGILYQIEISQSYQTHLKFQSNSALILK